MIYVYVYMYIYIYTHIYLLLLLLYIYIYTHVCICICMCVYTYIYIYIYTYTHYFYLINIKELGRRGAARRLPGGRPLSGQFSRFHVCFQLQFSIFCCIIGFQLYQETDQTSLVQSSPVQSSIVQTSLVSFQDFRFVFSCSLVVFCSLVQLNAVVVQLYFVVMHVICLDDFWMYVVALLCIVVRSIFKMSCLFLRPRPWQFEI